MLANMGKPGGVELTEWKDGRRTCQKLLPTLSCGWKLVVYGLMGPVVTLPNNSKHHLSLALAYASLGWCCFDMWSIKVQQSGYKTVEGDAKLLSSALTATGKAYGCV